MDIGSCHASETSLLESHDQSPTSSISRDLDMLTSPASNIISPPMMSPRRGQNRFKQLTNSSKKELEIAEILSMLGSSPTKILVAQPQRIELERPQFYSNLDSYQVSIERVEQESRHCVALLPQDNVTHSSSHVRENVSPVEDIQKRNDISADLPLASTITLPTSLSLSLPAMLPVWSSKNDLSSIRPWTQTQKVDKAVEKSVSESQSLGVFAPRVFNNNINKESLAPAVISHHGSSLTVTSTAVGPSTHVTSTIDSVVPTILPSTQYTTSSRLPTTSNATCSKFIIGGLPLTSNDTSQTTTTSSYMPINTVLPFSFMAGSAVSTLDPTGSNRGVMPSSISSPVVSSYPVSSIQQPHIIGARSHLEVDEMQRRLQKKRHRSSTDSSSSVSLDMLSQVTDNASIPNRSQAALNADLSTARLLPPIMPTNMPSSSISSDTSVVTTQPDLTKTPFLAYPYQPNLFPYMLGRPMMPMTWLDMQQRLNPTSTIRHPIYPSLMQSSPLIGFDPTGTLFKPQPQFSTNLLSSPFLPPMSFGNNIDSPSLQQPPMRPFMASNPGTPTSTLSPTAQSSPMPIVTKESPLLHSSFTNLSMFGTNSSIGSNRGAATPPITTSAEISPSRSVITGSWPPFQPQMSPMMGFSLPPGKFVGSSNQSSPLLGIPHTVLPVSCSPLLVSQLGTLTDCGNKKDNNVTPTGSHPVPNSKHGRRYYHHHQSKEQLSERNDPKHKPGVIAFAGHNTTSSSSYPVTQSDCYVVVSSPSSSATTTVSSAVLSTNFNSSVVTSEHQLPARPPTSVYMQNELVTPTVLPFQSLVSKMMVKKPRGRRQTKTTPENKNNSPKRPGRRGRKPTATTSMSSIITASVVEKLAGTPLLDVIAPSGLDMGDLPGNKKDTQSKETPQHTTAVVSEHTTQQFSRPANTNDQPTSSSSQSLVEVSASVANASPAKLDSACSLLSLSQSVLTTIDATHNTTAAAPSPVIIADKDNNDGETVAQVRRPSSVTAAEAMLMFTNVVDKKSIVSEKPLSSPVTEPHTDASKTTEASTEDVIVVQDETQVEEADNTSKEEAVHEEPLCEEKVEDNFKEDCEVNCTTTTATPLVSSSPSSHDGAKADNTKGEGGSENNQNVSETNHSETMDTAVDNVEVVNSVSEEVISNGKDNDTQTSTTSQDIEHPSTVDEDGNDTHSNNQNDTYSDIKSDIQDDTTDYMNQLAVTNVGISAAADNEDGDGIDNNDVEHSPETPVVMEESEMKDQANVNDNVHVQDNVVTDGTSGVKSNWEEVSDDELLDADLTPPLAKKSKMDDGPSSNKPTTLTLDLPQTEDSGNVALSSEASTPLLDDDVVPARQVSVSSCISLYDDAMFEGDTFEIAPVNNVQTVNGDACENGVESSVIATMHTVIDASKPDAISKIKQINPFIRARRKYRTQSIDSEGSSYGKESKRDTNTLTLPDSRQDRNRSTSPRRKPQPDSTTSPKELETDYRDSLHNPTDRIEWNSRSHKSRERGRNPRKQPLLHKNYGDYYDRQPGGTQRYAQNLDYRSGSSRSSNSIWNNSHYKHSSNNNYTNQHFSHYTSEQDGRRSGQGNFKRHVPHYRQDSNKNNRNSGRDLSQWNKRDYHGRKQEGCDSASYRGSNAKFQHHIQEANTGNYHHNRSSALSVHSCYSTQSSVSGRHGDRSYEQISDEEPSSTAASFKHQPTSISEASNSAVSDNSNSGSGSDSELESNHSSASRPVSRASSVKSSSSRSNKERLYSRKEPSSQRIRHHPYHHNKHNSNSTGYNSRRH